MSLTAKGKALFNSLLVEQKGETVPYQLVNGLSSDKPVDKVISQFEDVLFAESEPEFDSKIQTALLKIKDLDETKVAVAVTALKNDLGNVGVGIYKEYVEEFIKNLKDGSSNNLFIKEEKSSKRSCLTFNELKKRAIGFNEINTKAKRLSLEKNGKKLGDELIKRNDINSKLVMARQEFDNAKNLEKTAKERHITSLRETFNLIYAKPKKSYKERLEEYEKVHLTGIKDALESAKDKTDQVSLSNEKRITFSNLKVALEEDVKEIKKITDKVNKGDKVKKSEFIKYLKENLSKESVIKSIASQELKADNDLKTTIVKKIEDHKKDGKGLNKSIYRNGKEFTNDGIIKYYNEKTGSIKHNYSKQKNNKDDNPVVIITGFYLIAGTGIIIAVSQKLNSVSQKWHTSINTCASAIAEMWSLIDYILQITPYSGQAGELHPIASLLITFILLTVGYLMGNSFWHKLLGRNKFLPQGKHAYVTGGSNGLGRAIAKLLASKGAHVTIVARGKEDLNTALEEIKNAAKDCEDYKNLIFTAISADLTRFCKPGIFIEQDISIFENSMQLNYFGTLYTIHDGVKRMVQQEIKGKVVLVSSILGLISFIGFSQYSPTKYAIKGLAETLRNELILYGIDVHCYFPGTIDSPGLKEENKTKPKISSDIEGSNAELKPDEAAKILYKSLCKGEFFITSDFGGDLCRAACKGPVNPTNNFVVDNLLCNLAWIGGIPFRYFIDKKVKNST
ncbi:12113_t:CDS:10 [Funneliformis geosporum]|uniref:3-dehydrosphinganine reductase n=1 Tax=Funneliformis geosporum TaxID=1117311 RepID=A0A9W4SLW2_9GLOM|nr:12113_t:CDS:10 [Funneliformis geosporum]